MKTIGENSKMKFFDKIENLTLIDEKNKMYEFVQIRTDNHSMKFEGGHGELTFTSVLYDDDLLKLYDSRTKIHVIMIKYRTFHIDKSDCMQDHLMDFTIPGDMIISKLKIEGSGDTTFVLTGEVY